MPLRFQDLVKRVRSLAPGVTFDGDGAKHPFRFTRPDGRVFPLKAHNAEKTEIDDVYIKSLCRFLDLDFETLMDKKRAKAAAKAQLAIDEPTPPPAPPPALPPPKPAK